MIGRVGALGDDALQPPLDRHLQCLLATADDVRAVDQAVRRRLQDFRQQRLALVLRTGGQVHAVHLQDVEQDVGQRGVLLARQRGLQQAEVLLPSRSGDQFAVEHRLVQIERFERTDDLRRLAGPFAFVARPQAHAAAPDFGDQAVAVPFRFVQPVVAGRHLLLELRQLRGAESRMLRRGARAIEPGGAMRPALTGRDALLGAGCCACADFRRCASARGGTRARWRRYVVEQIIGLARAGESVAFLEQQPLRLARRRMRAHQVPAALELVAEHAEAQVPLRQLRLGIAIGAPQAAVEGGDMAATVLPFRYLAFKLGVVDGVVLDFGGQTFNVGIEAGALRHRPALERVAHLQAEVVMAPAGVVQLYDEDGALAAPARYVRVRLWGAVETALASVFLQAHGGSSPPL